MSRIPFRRKKQTPAERAIDLGAKALKLYAASRVAKKGAKVPLVGVGLAGALVAVKKLTGRKATPGTTPAPYTPPPAPQQSAPVPDKGRRESPHGDVAADLLKGDDRTAAPGGRNVGAAQGGASSAQGGGSSQAPPAGTGGTSDGADVAAKEVPPPSEAQGDADATESGTPSSTL